VSATPHPLQNRVTPSGEIIRHSARGRFMGNRGCLHDGEQNLGTARWRSKLWITCVTVFKGRQREVMSPGRYTELFFLDEAVALAVGHRPCAECRREDFRRFVAAWADGNGVPVPRAGEMDRVLHEARIDPKARAQRTFRANVDDLPDGTFIRWGEARLAHLLLGALAYPFDSYAYGPPVARPQEEEVDVMTPHPTVNTLRADYRPVTSVQSPKAA
jgi:hypothetical protein